MSFTPDGFPLLGETASVRGLWLGEAIWVTHSGGAGQGARRAHDPRRRVASTSTRPTPSATTTTASAARTPAPAAPRATARSTTSSTRASSPSRPAACGARPFYERQAGLGARFFESAGWERPQWYEANAALLGDDGGYRPASEWAARDWSPIAVAEHLALPRARRPVRRLAVHEGRGERARAPRAYLQRLAANNVDRPVGTIVYTAMLGPRAGIMCDLTITRTGDDRYWVVTGGAVGKHDLAWMRRNLPADGSVSLHDRTSGLCCIGVWGPLARDARPVAVARTTCRARRSRT